MEGGRHSRHVLIFGHSTDTEKSYSPSVALSVNNEPSSAASIIPTQQKHTLRRRPACVVAVPLSIGQAIALSPRLREWMLGDDVEEDGGGFSSRKIISLVRNYWGCEDYVPPVGRPQLKHAEPGHRYEWKEDNQSSFLALVGLYTPKDVSDASNTPTNDEVPMSLVNEPPSNVRHDQNILSQYLSTKTNPTGVKTRLSLLPFSTMDEGVNVDTDGDAGYETECTFPANTSTNTLRELCQGSDAQGLKRDLAEGDPAFRSKSIDETIRTKSWNEDCSWVASLGRKVKGLR